MKDKTAELIIRALADTLPTALVDGVYLYGQTIENQDSVLKAAHQADARKILMLNTKPRSGYPGFHEWRKRLLDLGVDPNRIEEVPMDDSEPLHTRSESQAIIRHAKQKGYISILVSAPPFHQPRAFMTAITVALEEYPELAVYSYPGLAQHWHEEVRHSQGTLKGRRTDLIHQELERIQTYRNKGDLAAPEDILAYLEKRC